MAESILDADREFGALDMDGRSSRPNKRPELDGRTTAVSAGLACASAGCDNAVGRHSGRVGRPLVYGSPACRPSRIAAPTATRSASKVEQEDHDGRDRPRPLLDGHARRGPHDAIVCRDLGRFSATVFVRRTPHAPAPPAGRRGHRVDIGFTPGERIP